MSWVTIATLLIRAAVFVIKWKYPSIGAMLSGQNVDTSFRAEYENLQSVVNYGRVVDELSDAERTELFRNFVLYRD